MTDRPRAERIEGKTVLYERGVFSRTLSRREAVALLAELAVLIELDVVCEGQTPPIDGLSIATTARAP